MNCLETKSPVLLYLFKTDSNTPGPSGRVITTDSEPTFEVAVLFPGFPGVLSHSALYENPPFTFWFIDSIAFLKVKVIFLPVIETVATSAPFACSDCVAISVILTPSGASIVKVSPSLTDLPVKSQSKENATF